MSDLILHHYPLSTFCEKVRLAMGLKGLAWREVVTPVIMPKPDLVALTGGYRRAPVLQIGADIFCDTQLILRRIEELHPEPTLFPDHRETEANILAWWAERHLFLPALGFVANENPALYPPDFVDERREFGFTLGLAEVRPLFSHYVQQFAAHLAWFAGLLADGRPYLLGDRPSAADLAAFPTFWFLRLHARDAAERHFPLAPLEPWFARIDAIGRGNPTEISGMDALAIARDATPAPEPRISPTHPSDPRPGANVTVTPDDTGRDPVAGELLFADDTEIVLRRHDATLGDLHLHFPRAGYDLAAA